MLDRTGPKRERERVIYLGGKDAARIRSDEMERYTHKILETWFGGLSVEGIASPLKSQRWFQGGAEFDELLRKDYLEAHQIIAALPEGSPESAPDSLAYIIALDQFSRNLFRGSKEAFAYDERALAEMRRGIALGYDRALVGSAKSFYYMPLMHSEALDDQLECVERFKRLMEESGDGLLRDLFAVNYDFAVQHLRIVERFGHFPHRSGILGRPLSDEEREFLTKPGSSF